MPGFRPWLSAGIFVGLLLLWQALLAVFRVPAYIFPAPAGILAKFVANVRSGLPLKHAGITCAEIAAGFVLGCLLGLLLAVLISRSRTVEEILLPYLIANQVIPKVAIAPLFILWFGFGLTSKVVIVVLVVFFPMLINALTGFRSVDEDKHRLMRSIDATRWQTFWRLEVPSSLPHIFAGLKVALNLAVVAAIVGEFVESQAGLGYIVLVAYGLLDTELMFAALLLLFLIGIALYLALLGAERAVLTWHASVRATPEAA